MFANNKVKFNSDSDPDSDGNSSSEEHNKPHIKTKPVNLWTSCIQDEQISNSLNSLTSHDKSRIERGVESYTHEISDRDRYYHDDNSYTQKQYSNNQYSDNTENEQSLTKSFGKKSYLTNNPRDKTRRIQKNQIDSTSKLQNNSKFNNSKFNNSKFQANKKHTNSVTLAGKFKLGKRFRLNHRGKLEVGMVDSDFIAELCYRLRETQTTKPLFSELLDIIGQEKTIELLLETEKIELNGGLPVQAPPAKKETTETKADIEKKDNKDDEKEDTIEDKQETEKDIKKEADEMDNEEVYSDGSDIGPKNSEETVAKTPNSLKTGINLSKSSKSRERKTAGGVFLSLVYSLDQDSEQILKVKKFYQKKQHKDHKEFMRRRCNSLGSKIKVDKDIFVKRAKDRVGVRTLNGEVCKKEEAVGDRVNSGKVESEKEEGEMSDE